MAKHKIHYEYRSIYWWRNKDENNPKYSYYLRSGYCYRLVATTPERRANCAAMADGHYVRGKRRYNQLPTAWDDPRISRWRVRSWKDGTRCRKQYMVKLEG